MVDRKDYLIVSKNETFSCNRIAVVTCAAEHPITVCAEEREEFLKFFFFRWKYKKREYNMTGLRNLAEYLCAFADFRSAENDNTTVSAITIEKELFNLKKRYG